MARRKPPVPSRMQDVLLTVLDERLMAAGKGRRALAPYLDKTEAGADAYASRIVNGKHDTPSGGIDNLVNAYAAVIGDDPLELWAASLARWRTIRSDEDEWISEWRAQHADDLRLRAAARARDAKAARSRSARRKRG